MVLQKENGDECTMSMYDRFPRTNLDSGINKKTKRIVCNDIYEE